MSCELARDQPWTDTMPPGPISEEDPLHYTTRNETCPIWPPHSIVHGKSPTPSQRPRLPLFCLSIFGQIPRKRQAAWRSAALAASKALRPRVPASDYKTWRWRYLVGTLSISSASGGRRKWTGAAAGAAVFPCIVRRFCHGRRHGTSIETKLLPRLSASHAAKPEAEPGRAPAGDAQSAAARDD